MGIRREANNSNESKVSKSQKQSHCKLVVNFAMKNPLNNIQCGCDLGCEASQLREKSRLGASMKMKIEILSRIS